MNYSIYFIFLPSQFENSREEYWFVVNKFFYLLFDFKLEII